MRPYHVPALANLIAHVVTALGGDYQAGLGRVHLLRVWHEIYNLGLNWAQLS